MAKVREVNRYNEFLALQESWENVLNKSKEKNVFLSWEWLSTWWKHYGKRRKPLVLLIEDKDQIIAIAPLMCSEYSTKLTKIRIRQIEFIGTGPSDYHDFILTKNQAKCLRLFMEYLNDYTTKWDSFELKEIPESAEFIDFLRNTTINSFKLEERVSSTCPCIPLPDTCEAFSKKLNGNVRRNLGRCLRRLKEKHTVEFRNYLDMDSIEDAMKSFFDLHQKRWKQKGVEGQFADHVYREFHLDVARCFAERGWLNLSFLVVDKKPVSSSYSFEYDQKLYYYLSGFDPEYSKYSVGSLQIMHTIDDCIQRGLETFDFLRGAESYKKHWNTLNRRTINVRLIRKGLVPRIYDWVTQTIPSSVWKRKIDENQRRT